MYNYCPMDFIQSLPEKGNLLLISNGCGSGHIQAASSLITQLTVDRPALHPTTIDVYKHSFGNWIGQHVIDTWSRQQKEGDIKALNHYLNYQWVERWILSIITFFAFLVALLKYDVDAVVDVQPFALGALLSAVHVVNFVRKIFGQSHRQPIKVSMLLTELPNPDAVNFFSNIKALSSSDRDLFRLVTTKPLLKEGETEEEFWKTHCHLSLAKGQVVYDDLPLRPAFSKQKTLPRPDALSVLFSSNEEKEKMMKVFGEEKIQEEEGKLIFPLEETDRVFSILLGGQACIPSAKAYLLKKLEMIRNETSSNAKELLFVLCGKYEGEESLFSQICHLVEEERKKGTFPERARVIPLSFQTDQEIAPLLARSDQAIIKSGGLTAMEAYEVPPQEILIHAMSSQEELSEDELIRVGMPIWEGGNARYLQNTRGARVVTPKTIGNLYV